MSASVGHRRSARGVCGRTRQGRHRMSLIIFRGLPPDMEDTIPQDRSATGSRRQACARTRCGTRLDRTWTRTAATGRSGPLATATRAAPGERRPRRLLPAGRSGRDAGAGPGYGRPADDPLQEAPGPTPRHLLPPTATATGDEAPASAPDPADDADLDRLLLRFTNSEAQRFESFARAVAALQKGERAPAAERERERNCPRCGLRYPDQERSVCPPLHRQARPVSARARLPASLPRLGGADPGRHDRRQRPAHRGRRCSAAGCCSTTCSTRRDVTTATWPS